MPLFTFFWHFLRNNCLRFTPVPEICRLTESKSCIYICIRHPTSPFSIYYIALPFNLYLHNILEPCDVTIHGDKNNFLLRRCLYMTLDAH